MFNWKSILIKEKGYHNYINYPRMTDIKKIHGYIFKIINLNDEKEYFIAATTDKPYRRLYRYKIESDKASLPCLLIYYRMKKVGKSNFISETIEERDYNSKAEMKLSLRKYINKLNPILNKNISKEEEYDNLFPKKISTSNNENEDILDKLI